MSDRLSIGKYSLEITDQQVVIRDQKGAIVETVDLASLDGNLTLPDGRSVDIAALLADAGEDLSEFRTAAGPFGDGSFGPMGNNTPGTFRAFNGEAGGGGFRSAAGALAGTTLKYGQIEGEPKKEDEDETEQQSSILVTWSSHDQWQVPENQDGAELGPLVDGNPADFTFKLSDPRFEVVNGVLQLRDGFSFDYEAEAFVDVEVTATSRTGDTQTRTFHIDVLDQNEAQTDLSLDGATVVENTAGAIIGNLTVIDPDAGDSQSFQVSDSRFEVVNGQLKLKDGVSLDFEAEPIVDVIVTATDKGGHQIQETFTIAVGDVNEAQTSMSLSGSKVAENAKGAVIGTLSVVDPDAGDSQSYNVSDNRFEVVNGQLKLKNGTSLNYESTPNVNVTVTATDKGGHEIQQTFTINVQDVNERQTALRLSGTRVTENASGALIGKLTVTDPDKGDTQTFKVSDNRFEVVNGQLKLKSGVSLDFESTPSVRVSVTATDSANHTITRTFTINVRDVNEAQTSIGLANSKVAENAAGAIIGALTVADPDKGDTQTFKVSDNRFEVVSGQLKLKSGVSLDFESEPSVNVTVTATDKGKHTISETFTISVGDVNEAQSSLSLDGNSVAENAAGAIIGTLSVVDPDVADSQGFQVSDSRFEVVDGQLRLKDGIALDFESEPGINVTVIATDQGGHDIQQTFAISVGDVNEAQTSLSIDNNTVAENAAGAVIGNLAVIDPDAGDSQSFQVSDNRFEVVDGQLKLKGGVSLDFEVEPSVNVTVTATDKSGHQIAQQFTVGVGNVNEAPTSIALNTDGGVTLINGSFEANTLNNGQWKLFNAIDGWSTTTKIEVQNNVTNKASNGSQVVEMDADKGIDAIYQDVKTVAGHVYDLSFDTATRRDTKGTDTIEVYWNGAKIGTIEPGSTTWQTSTFQVVGTGGNDRLEFREQSGDNDTYGGLLDNVSLKEHANTIAENVTGAVVGTLSVVDPDAGDTHTYGVSDSRFEVVNGVLKLKDGVSLDFESEQSVSLTVIATDNAGNSAHQSFTIGVANVAETGAASGSTSSIAGVEVWSSGLGKGQTTLGSNDDDLFIDTASIGPVRMGDGYDTVHLAQQDRSFDQRDAVKLEGIEAIDTTGYGVNKVALSLTDVLDMTDADNHLTVIGDKGDVVTLSGDTSGHHWQVVATNGDFTTYAWSDPVQQAVVEISNQLTAQII